MTRPRKETQRRRPSEGDLSAVADERADERADGDAELDLGIPPATAAAQSPVQVLVGAYADAYRDGGGRPTKAVLAACGRNVKRLIEDDDIPLPVILQAVQRAGAGRSKDLDRQLGEAQQSYGRQASRKAMFAAWDQIAARYSDRSA